MALGFAALAGAISAAASAANAASKNKKTSSSSSSSSYSSGGSKSIADYQSIWQEANAAGDQARMDWAHQMAEAERAKQGYSGGADGSQYIPLGYRDSDGNQRNSTDNTDWAANYKSNVQSGNWDAANSDLTNRMLKLTESGGADRAQEYMQWMADSQRAQQQAEAYAARTDALLQQYQAQQEALRKEQQAKVEANIAELNAQKPLVQQAGAQANRAAQQNYMNALNPNGANAEQLAALGLTQSGMSESAAISAGNAYQQAVNSNAQNVNNQLAAIDLAITQAQLSGDIATAQQLQSYYNTVLNAGMQSAGNILGADQWALSNQQQGFQDAIGNSFTQAGLTGELNGQPTMAGQQLSYTIEGLDLQNQLQQYALLLQQTYGMDQAAAQLEAQRIANQGAQLGNTSTQLANEYQKLYNQYQQIINDQTQRRIR